MQPEYRWPLLCYGVVQLRETLPASYPGDFSIERLAEVDGSLMQRQLGCRGPELELVAKTVTLMATVAAFRNIHREGETSATRATMQWTTSIPLVAASPCRLKVEQVQNLFHRDFRTESVEVDSWHDFPRGVMEG